MIIEQLKDYKAFASLMETGHHAIIQAYREMAVVNSPVIFEQYKATTNLDTEWKLNVAKINVK